MIEILKNKMMIGVAVVLLSIIFINAGISNKLEENNPKYYNEMISINIK